MSSLLDDKPGVRERHLLRKRHNPLFDEQQRDVSNEQLALARLEDGVEMDRFLDEFHALVQKAAELQAHTPTETILEIKQQLDRSHQRACALPGDQTQAKKAIRKLLAAINRSIRAASADDSDAKRRLDDEEAARELDFGFQKLPLVSALTHPDAPIAEDELVPCLLSEPAETLTPTLKLFDMHQLASIVHDAETLLLQRDPQRTLSAAWERLHLIEVYYRETRQDPASATHG